jgi:carboxymethylenebutenolidase
VSSETIDVLTPRGTMPVHLHHPSEGGAVPLVVLLMDAPGIRAALHGHAERLAAAGYTAALPDLFYAIDPADRPRPERLAAGDPEEFKRMGAVVGRMRDDHVLEELELLLAALGHGSAAPFGCVGFCMGGRFGLRAAQERSNQVAAAALLHPSRVVTDGPDSPHLGVDRVGGALYLGWGERDHVSPVSLIPPLRAQLEQHGVEHRIEVIAGADHGFTMPGMPAYDEAAAEQAWDGTLALLGEHLAG